MSQNSQLGKFPTLSTWEIPKTFDSENSKNFPNFAISQIIKFLKLHHFEECKIYKILQFEKLLKFHKFPIQWIIIYF